RRRRGRRRRARLRRRRRLRRHRADRLDAIARRGVLRAAGTRRARVRDRRRRAGDAGVPRALDRARRARRAHAVRDGGGAARQRTGAFALRVLISRLDPGAVAAWRDDPAREPPVLVDVREDWERAICAIDGALALPMQEVARRVGELPRERELVIVCHSGRRSAAVASWLAQQDDPALASARAIWQATQERLPQARAGLLPNVSASAQGSVNRYDQHVSGENGGSFGKSYGIGSLTVSASQ